MSLMIITLRIGLVCLQMVVAGVGSLGGLGVTVAHVFPFPRPLPRRTGPGLGGLSCTVRRLIPLRPRPLVRPDGPGLSVLV